MASAHLVFIFAVSAMGGVTEAIVNPGEVQQKCCPDGECYDLGPPWQSPARLAPDPDCVNDTDVYFALYTSNTLKAPTNYTVQNVSSISSAFNPANPTVLMFHGWMGSADAAEVFQIVAAYLIAVPSANVLFCDYSKVAVTINYPQAVSDIRVVARIAVKFLKYLLEFKGLPLNNLHITGVSLGAHAAGYVGKELPGIPRITGLDPAAPLFQGRDSTVRLSRGDGLFVEGVNTNGNPFWGAGTSDFDLDVNFLVNGGYDQPGCLNKQNIWDFLNFLNWKSVTAGLNMAFCSHARCVDYYKEALQNSNCTFWGVPAEPLQVLASQLTLGYGTRYVINPSDCTPDTCVPMGIDTIKSKLRGLFIVRTNPSPLFCVSKEQQKPWWQKLLG